MSILDDMKKAMLETKHNHEVMLERLDNVLLGQGHVVCYVTNGAVMAMGYKTNELKEVIDCFITSLGRATRWTKNDAEKLANATKNGKGERPVAMHIREALELDIQRINESLKDLECHDPQ